MTQLNQEGTPHRTATRAPVGRPIRLQFDDALEVVEALCVNISIGGMFIRVEDSRPQGALVRFELLVDEERSIRGLGEVVWMRSIGGGGGREPGIGIKFRYLEQRDRQQIFKLVSQFIKERLAQRPSMTASPEPEIPPPVEEEGVIFRPPEDEAEELSTGWVEETPLPAAESAEAVSPGFPFETGAGVIGPEGGAEPPEEPRPQVQMAPQDVTPLRRADSRLPGSEELSGPLKLKDLGVLEPQEPTESPSVPAAGSEADLTAYEELNEPPSPRRASLWTILLLLLLGCVVAGVFFWEDLFGPRVPEEVEQSEPPPEGPRDGPPVESSESQAGDSWPRPPKPVSLTGETSPTVTSQSPADPPTRPLIPPPQAPRKTPPASPPASQQASPPPPPATSPPPRTTVSEGRAFTRLEDVRWSQTNGGVEVILELDGTVPESRLRHSRLGGSEPRELIRLYGVRQGFDRQQILVDLPQIRRIRFGYHKKSRGNELHIVLDMVGNARVTEVRRSGARVAIQVEGS